MPPFGPCVSAWSGSRAGSDSISFLASIAPDTKGDASSRIPCSRSQDARTGNSGAATFTIASDQRLGQTGFRVALSELPVRLRDGRQVVILQALAPPAAAPVPAAALYPEL